MAEEMSGPSESAARLASPESAQYMGQPQPPMASMAPYGRGPMRAKPIGQNGFNPCCCMSLRLGCYLLGGIALVSLLSSSIPAPILNILAFTFYIAELQLASRGFVKGTMPKDKTVVYVSLASTAYNIILDLLILCAAKTLNRNLAIVYAVLVSISALWDFVNAILNFLQGAALTGSLYLISSAFSTYFASCGYGLYMQIRDGEYVMMPYNMAPPL